MKLELSGLQAGQTVLIQGGAGGVGTIAIQLAHKMGATVLTTAKEAQRDALLQLGADRVVDYSKERLEDLKPADVMLDLIDGEVLAHSYSLVKKGGVIVTANQPPDKAM